MSQTNKLISTCSLLLLRQLLSTRRHCVQGCISSLATTVLQNGLVFLFFNRNVRCFLKQKSLRCCSEWDYIIPFRAFSTTQKVSIYSLFTVFFFNHKKQNYCKTKIFLLHMHMCVCSHTQPCG